MPGPEGARPPCAACLRLRWFLGLALPLIVLLGLRPGWAVALAAHLPEPLALAVMLNLAGAAGFAWRIAAARRVRRLSSRAGPRPT